MTILSLVMIQTAALVECMNEDMIFNNYMFSYFNLNILNPYFVFNPSSMISVQGINR